MKRTLLAAALAAALPALAIEPADVRIVTDPAVKVTVTRRKTNSSKTVTVTVNAQDKVTAATTAPPLPPPDMHVGLHVDMATIGARNAGVKDDRLATTGQMPTPSDIGQFRTVCEFALAAYDDPIVLPGKPGMSHLHNFFGNTSADANSTLGTLRLGASTCRGGMVNASGYWQPAILDGATGRWIRPTSAIIYYKNGYKLPVDTHFAPPPEGLKMVAGNPLAKGPGENGAGFFTCIDASGSGAHTETIPACAPGNMLWASVDFPQCWDGKNLDSPDHRSHMAYPEQLQKPPFTWSCPSTHPVAIPDITINVQYAVQPGDDTSKWRLASDGYALTQPGGYSIHADWFGAWKPEIAKAWTDGCNNAVKDCGATMLGDGRVMQEFGGN